MDILKEVRASPMSRLQIRAVTVAIALMLIDGMDVAVAAYAAPALSKAWSLDPVTLGFLLSAGLVGMAAGSLFLTPFSDKNRPPQNDAGGLGPSKHGHGALGLRR